MACELLTILITHARRIRRDVFGELISSLSLSLSSQSHGYKVHAIMSCGNITTLRTLLDSPDDFITDAVNAAQELGLDGFNLDFEPCVRLLVFLSCSFLILSSIL